MTEGREQPGVREGRVPAEDPREASDGTQEGSRGPGNPVWSILPAVAVGLLSLLIGILVLLKGHPHEDAYILFKYARQLGAGAGITYFPGGPHAEGATDFLWLVLLAFASRLGISPAVGAAGLSAAALAVVAWLFLREALARPSLRRPWHFAAASFLLLGSCNAAAGYVGFSSAAFGALALGALVLWVRGAPRGTLWLPYLALLLGLFRPDGVVIGAGLVLLALRDAVVARRARRFLVHCLLALVAGAVYFLWRWWYFKVPLPLPFYVKFHGEATFPGLATNWLWLTRTAAPLLVLLLALAVVTLRRTDSPGRRLLLGLLPFGIHVLLLTFGAHTQNVAERFQSPATLALSFAVFALLAKGAPFDRFWRKAAFLACLLLAFYPQLSATRWALWEVLQKQYIERFGYDAGRLLGPADTIALTEAGRLGYWTKARVIDLVGLNTPEIATGALRPEDLERWNPDVVMFHTARILDLTDADRKLDLTRVEGSLVDRLREPYAAMAREAGQEPAGSGAGGDSIQRLDPARRAALVASIFLSRHPDEYDVFAMDYYGFPVHLYGVRRAWPKSGRFEELLRKAPRAPSASYLTLWGAS